MLLRRNVRTLRPGYGTLVLAPVLWMSASIPAAKLFDQGLAPLGVTTWVLIVSSLFLALSILRWRPEFLRIRRRDTGRFLVIGLTNGIFYLCYYEAIHRMGLAATGAFLGITPVVGLVLGALFLREQIRIANLIGVFLGLTGVLAMVSALGDGLVRFDLWGIVFGIGLTISFALFAPVAKGLLREYHYGTLVLYSLLAATLVLLLDPRAVWWHEAMTYTSEAWRIVTVIALLSNIPAFILFMWSMSGEEVSAGAATFSAAMQPGLATLLGLLFLGEVLTTRHFIGLILITTGALLVFGVLGRLIRWARRPTSFPPSSDGAEGDLPV